MKSRNYLKIFAKGNDNYLKNEKIDPTRIY